MFNVDVHRVTKVSGIEVHPLGEGFGESGYVTISLSVSKGHDLAKFTFFTEDLSTIWDQFVEAGVTADAVYMKKHGEKA